MTPTLTCKPRSPEAMEEVFELLDVERNQLYLPGDIDGDGKPETRCNWYLHDWSALLGCPIPKVRANDQIEWLRTVGIATHGWRPVIPSVAVEEAGRGCPVVVGWRNPEPLLHDGKPVFEGRRQVFRPGHVAVVRATPALEPETGRPASGVWITQAGAHNYRLAKLIQGFGRRAPLHWFAHA